MGPVAVAPAPAAVVDALESAQVTHARRRSARASSSASPTPRPRRSRRRCCPSGLLRPDDPRDPGRHPERRAQGARRRADQAAGRRRARRGPARTSSMHDRRGRLRLHGRDRLHRFPFPAMPPFARVALMMAKYAMFGVIPAPIPSLFQAAGLADREDTRNSRGRTSSTPTSWPRTRATSSTSRPARARHQHGLLGSAGPRRRAAAGAHHRHGPRRATSKACRSAPTATPPSCPTPSSRSPGSRCRCRCPNIGAAQAAAQRAAAGADQDASCSRPSG